MTLIRLNSGLGLSNLRVKHTWVKHVYGKHNTFVFICHTHLCTWAYIYRKFVHNPLKFTVLMALMSSIWNIWDTKN